MYTTKRFTHFLEFNAFNFLLLQFLTSLLEMMISDVTPFVTNTSFFFYFNDKHKRKKIIKTKVPSFATLSLSPKAKF